MCGPAQAAVLHVPDEAHVDRTGRRVSEVPGLPVHEPVTRCGGRPDGDRSGRHYRRRRQRERGDPARAEAGEHDKSGGQDRCSHRDPVRRPEERPGPPGAHEDRNGRGHRLPFRCEERGDQREPEDRREHEVAHRRVHARVERKVRAVEVREAVVEPRPDGREAIPGMPGNQVDAEGDPRSDRRNDDGAEQAKRAPLQRRRGECEREEHERAPERRDRLLDPQPRPRDDEERRRSDADRPGRATHGRSPPRRLLRARRRGRPPAARPRSARLRPAAEAAQAQDGERVRRSSLPRHGRARPRGE